MSVVAERNAPVADWKRALRNAFKDPSSLLAYLNLKHLSQQFSDVAHHQMPLRVPVSFVNRMEKGNAFDPLLLQIFPGLHEEVANDQFTKDPLEERHQSPQSALIHKYPSRVLLIAHSACAVHCRYCFRREFDYQDHVLNRSQWLQNFQYIFDHPEINEVILSGGDPLLLNNEHLKFFIERVSAIPHIKRLRIHSRVPVVLPERITHELIEVLTQYRLQVIVVIHANHANELDGSVAQALDTLAPHCTLLNQSTLLKGVNDCAERLADLSERLFECGVMPYYLHTLDKVRGTTHFHISDESAWQIYQDLQSKLPGFLVPKLVKEVPYRRHKTLLTGAYE